MKNGTGAMIETLLTTAGVAVKQLDAYGRQVVVTLRCEDQAKKCAAILGKAFKIRGIIQTMDDAAENEGTVLRSTKVSVWRVYACAQ